MRNLTALSVILLLGVAAGAAFGDDEGPRAIQKGRWSIAISLPDGGGSTFGIWKMVSARSNFGVNIGVAHNHSETSYAQSPTSENSRSFYRWDISLQPSIKRYLSLHQSVSPYLLGAIKGGYGWSKETNRLTGAQPSISKSFTRNAAAALGLGVDWTPLEAVSIGAHTGLNLSLSSSSHGNQRFDFGDFGTLDSGLTMHVYF